MSNLTGVTNFFSTANEGFATTLAGTITAGATTVPLANMASLTDGSVFVGIIEPGGVNQQTFTGTVSQASTAITGVIWTRGTNVPHVSGVSVVDYVTGTDFNMMSTGVQKSLTQQGKLNAAALGQVYPVGCIYISTVNTNPATLFGFGTWVAFGQGRTLMGNGTSDATYTAGATGGASTVNASHTHLVYSTMGISSGALLPIRPDSIPGSSLDAVVTDTVGQTIAAQATGVELWQYPTLTGGNGAQSTLQPYIVTYFWNRTA